MKHYYSTIDGIVTTFSDIHRSALRGESILVYMERANAHGFDTAEFLLPSITCTKYSGFNEEERAKLTEFVRNNSSLIWEIAREDGEVIADVGGFIRLSHLLLGARGKRACPRSCLQGCAFPECDKDLDTGRRQSRGRT